MRADTARGIFIVIQNEKLPESFREYNYRSQEQTW